MYEGTGCRTLDLTMATSELASLIAAVEGGEPEQVQEAHREAVQSELNNELEPIVPPVPETLEEAGLPSSMLEHLIIKLLYSRGEMLGRDLSESMGLKFSVI